MYEFHALDNPVFPFIYHEDTLMVGPKCWRNWHENMELLYFLEGHATVICDGISYDMQPGQLFVVNPNCLHETHPQQTTKAACLIIGQSFLQQNGIDISSLEFTPHLPAEQVQARFSPVMAASRAQDPWAAAHMRLSVLQLLLWLLRGHSHRRQTPSGHSTSKETLLHAVRFLHSRVPGKVSVKDVAQACGLSTSYLMHEFKKTFGCTITAYTNRLRCEYAKPLLAAGARSIQECGYLSGFSDPSYFTKIFTRFTGQSPTDYRRSQS